MKTTLAVMAMAAGLLVLAGCSTPETRIKANPATYDALTPQQQQLVRNGQVGIGFTKQMVKLALGDPDRVYTITTKDGTSEAWSYVCYETSDGVFLYGGYYHRWWRGWYPYYWDYPNRVAYERFRVVFGQDGTVTAIRQEHNR